MLTNSVSTSMICFNVFNIIYIFNFNLLIIYLVSVYLIYNMNTSFVK